MECDAGAHERVFSVEELGSGGRGAWQIAMYSD